MSSDDRRFAALIAYVKGACIVMAGMSALGIVLLKVAPLLTLEQLIFQGWYGKTTLPPEAVKPFEFCYLLFAWLSVLAAATLYSTVRHGLAKRERWAYRSYVVMGVFWPLGAIAIGLYASAYWYLLSAGMMAVAFLPPVFLLRPHIEAE